MKFLSFIGVFLILSCLISGENKKDQKKPEQNREKKPQYVVSRIKGPVKLDGLSDEPAWEGIQPLPVVMHSPEFGIEPTEKTEFLVAYDDEYLYVAGRLFDREPEKILAYSKKRDSMSPTNDWFGLLIDSFNDKENALGFFTTPAGLRLDLTVYNDAQGELSAPPLNMSWNTFWDVAVKRNDDGWFVEMRIPFSSLRFQDKEGRVVMGLSAWRWIPHKNEVVIFPAISRKWGPMSTWKPSQAQEVVFEGVRGRKPLYVAPYVLGGYGQTSELNENETAFLRSDDPSFEAGLDIKYGITSNLTLDVTLNTDFAQVEADDEQINLTRFSLFFPEKRLFFQERSSIFDFNLGGPNRLFYSRSIGIHDEKPVRIYGGVRLVGRLGPWDLGFLSMQTAGVEDLPSENFTVLRVRRQVFNPYSYVGGIITSRLGTDGTFNTAYGLDGIIRLFGDDYLTFNWAQTFETEEENNPASLDQAQIGINWEKRTMRGFGYNLDYSRSGSAFNPGMGFMMREDCTRFGNQVFYGWGQGKKSPFIQHQVNLSGSIFLQNEDGSVESADFGPGWSFEMKSGYFGGIAAKCYREDIEESFSLSDDVEVPIGKYTFYALEGMLGIPPGKRLRSELMFYAGSFYDGWRFSLTATPMWSISSFLELSGLYQLNLINFPERNLDLTAHIGRLRLLAMLSTKFSASAFIQYNSIDDVVIANIRVRFNPREGNDLYLVYNEGINANRFREIPHRPYYDNRTIMIKYTYTFRL